MWCQLGCGLNASNLLLTLLLSMSYLLLYSTAALALRAVHGTVQAISRCHFEETDPESDELVLMKVRHPCILTPTAVLLVQKLAQYVTKIYG